METRLQRNRKTYAPPSTRKVPKSTCNVSNKHSIITPYLSHGESTMFKKTKKGYRFQLKHLVSPPNGITFANRLILVLF